MTTRKTPAVPAEDPEQEPDTTTQPDTQEQPAADDSGNPTPPQRRSALDDPQHPLHHLRNA